MMRNNAIDENANDRSVVAPYAATDADFSDDDSVNNNNNNNNHDHQEDDGKGDAGPLDLNLAASSAPEHRSSSSPSSSFNELEDEIDYSKDPYQASSPYSKYLRYELRVAHEEGDRALQLKMCSWKRPHMRALHCAWISFFLAFTIWVTPSPLLKEIATSLNLSKEQVWTSSITNDVTAIIMRILLGPVCDAQGARIPMAVVLVAASIPTAMLGLIKSGTGLSVIRFFIGIAGSSFVMAQSWPTRMFARELAGTANGIVGGWGNLGGAFAQLFVGRILFPLFRDYVYGGNAEKSWRTVAVVPAAMALIWGCIVAFISDDAPMGNYREMRKRGTMDRIYYTTSLKSGAKLNTWILYVQYACCFGVELAMNNAAVVYFSSEFGLTTEQAATLGFAYGSMNIFARGLGGYLSDQLNLKCGLRGRLWLQSILLILEGLLIIVFSFASTLGGAIAAMCIFSIFTQSSEGAIFGVVPYVSKLYTGAVSGLVGSGGNLGSVVYGLLFRQLPYRAAFLLMGCIVVASSFLSVFIRIPCHAHMLGGQDNHAVIQARERFLKRKGIEEAALLAAEAAAAAAASVTSSSNPLYNTNNEDDAVQMAILESQNTATTSIEEEALVESGGDVELDGDTTQPLPVAPPAEAGDHDVVVVVDRGSDNNGGAVSVGGSPL